MKRFLTYIFSALTVIACTPSLQSLDLDATTLTLQPGAKAWLTVKVTPSRAADKTMTWASSDDAIAAVSQSGEVTAITVGNCTVSVSCDGKKAECEVVVVPIPVTSVTLDKSTASLLVGEDFQLTATVLPDDATNREVTWKSSKTDVVTVDNGLVTAVGAGEATITAMSGACSAECLVSVSVPFEYGGMCLEAVSNGSVNISNPNRLTIDYKVENRDWVSASDNEISIEVRTNERVWFRGLNKTYTVINEDGSASETIFHCINSDFCLYGNLMSLIYGDDYETKAELSGEFVFYKLFCENKRIVNHPTEDIVLSATILSESCYRNMFYGCSKLTRAPKLPAKVLADACYSSMFAYCTSLKQFPDMAATDMAYMSCTWMMMGSGIEQAPELPAMNLAQSCYEFMFMECPNLKKGPSILPATELAATCYTGMFQRSDKLENAPQLPATELKYSCYSHMFNGCSALKKAPELPATVLAEACYQRMFGNSGLTEAPKLPATNLEVMCYQYMFEGCKSLTRAPILPALQLNYWCYERMFHDCSNLNYINAAFLTQPSSGYTPKWVEGVAEKGTFVKNPEAKWDVRGMDGIPEGWTVE